MPKCTHLTRNEAAEMIVAESNGTLSKVLGRRSDTALEEIAEWAGSWASQPDGARRLLSAIPGRVRRVGSAVDADVFATIRTAALKEMNDRCWA